jgi:hypothetical protein
VPRTRLPQTAAEIAAACGSSTVAALRPQNLFAQRGRLNEIMNESLAEKAVMGVTE